MDVLHKYNVEFKLSHAHSSIKSISTSNEALTTYILHHGSLDDAERLLSGVEKVLNDKVPLAGGTSKGMSEAVITKDATKLYLDSYEYYEKESIPPDFELPTYHFKIIIAAWVQFLRPRT